MSKGKNSFIIEDDDMLNTQPRGGSKLPIDNTGANKGLFEFQEIPVQMLHPFTQKTSFDFSRHNQVLSQKFAETVKEFGIIEALIVRKSPIKRDCFEIISGESRWTHAKEIGLKTVPCRIMDVNDDKAHRLFVILNLMRREMTPRDKINAWYDYYEERKAQGATFAELNREFKEDAETANAINAGKGGGITYRMIQNYIKMHDLIAPWLDRLDDGTATGRIGYRVAFFPDDVQEDMLKYKLNENKLQKLYEQYFGKNKTGEWSPDILAKTFPLFTPSETEGGDNNKRTRPKLTKQERAFGKAFRAATPQMVETLRTVIHPDDYDRFEEIIPEAIKLYYAQKESE